MRISVLRDVHFSNKSELFLHKVASLCFEHGDLFDPLFNGLFYDNGLYVEPERVLIEIFAPIIAPTIRVPDVLRFSSFILRGIPEHLKFWPSCWRAQAFRWRCPWGRSIRDEGPEQGGAL